MKKKLLIILAVMAVIACLFVISAGAATAVTDDGTNMTLGAPSIDGLTVDDGVGASVGFKYSLDEETKTASVTGVGSAFTAGGVIAIPSTVTYNGVTYTVTSVGDKALNGIASTVLIVPDTIKSTGDSSFANASRNEIYIGSGLSELSSAMFSAVSELDVFVCKSKITKIGTYAFNCVKRATSSNTFDFDLSNVVEFGSFAFASCTAIKTVNLSNKVASIGESAFKGASNIDGTIIIPEGTTLGIACFNGMENLDYMIVEVADGETKVLPQEFLSSGTNFQNLKIYINGNAIAGGYAVLPAGSGHELYMPTEEALQAFVTSVTLQNYNRLGNLSMVYACGEGKAFKCSSSAVLTLQDGTEAPHNYSETRYVSANCVAYDKYYIECYGCKKQVISTEGTEYGPHDFEISIKAPNCQSKGYTEYDCTICKLQKTGDWTAATEHIYISTGYAVNGSSITISKACSACNTSGEDEVATLVNKCYIEGYGLFDATMDLITVSTDGVVTPNSSAAYDSSVIYFPSYVEINGVVVEVKTIQGFNKKSLSEIYVPDTVTRIVGGSNVGCFGNISTLKTVVVGKGVTELEREVFSMGNGATLDVFIFKGTITKIDTYAMQKMNAGDNIQYELNTHLTFLGEFVNSGGNLLKEVYITNECSITAKAFNGALGLAKCYIEGGADLDNAKSLPQEMFSGDNQVLRVYMNGYVIPGGNYVAPTRGAYFYFATQEQMVCFVKSATGLSGNDRYGASAFFCCADIDSEADSQRWRIATTDISENTTIDNFYHDSYGYNEHIAYGGIVTEATCQGAGSISSSCYMCNTLLTAEIIPQIEHSLDGGVITRMPDCKNLGAISYTCLKCDEVQELTIFNDYSTHEYKLVLLYTDGFTANGIERTYCTICDDKEHEDIVIGPIFKVIGYSIKDNRTGLACGYEVFTEALNNYESKMGKLKFGMLLANASIAKENGLLDENFALIAGNKGIQIEITELTYKFFNISITGFGTDALKALDLIVTAYVIADADCNGTKEISFIQHTMENKDNGTDTFGGYTLNTVSIDRADPQLTQPVALKKDE